MAFVYTVPLRHRLARALLLPALRLLFHILSPVKITGRENVPKKGAYVIALNHVSTYDPPFIISFWPTAPEAAGAVEIWERPGQSTLARLFGGIQVHRGQFDRQAVEKMFEALQSGRPLVIAPEGGRSHTPGMRQAEPGVAYVADKAGVPVIPVGIIGTTDDYAEKAFHFKRPPLEMRIGKPVRLPPVEGKGVARHQSLQANADMVMREIAALLPPEYHGVYAIDLEQEHDYQRV
jgi:1-acyl-sn-glycerol-3-phosphate acyltransferase